MIIDDLFRWTSNDKTGNYKHHALQWLKRGERNRNIATRLKELHLHKMEEVRNFLDRLYNRKEQINS